MTPSAFESLRSQIAPDRFEVIGRKCRQVYYRVVAFLERPIENWQAEFEPAIARFIVPYAEFLQLLRPLNADAFKRLSEEFVESTRASAWKLGELKGRYEALLDDIEKLMAYRMPHVEQFQPTCMPPTGLSRAFAIREFSLYALALIILDEVQPPASRATAFLIDQAHQAVRDVSRLMAEWDELDVANHIANAAGTGITALLNAPESVL